MSDLYILDDLGRPMEVEDAMVWARWYETGERIIAQTVVGDRLFVSTVFLGIDHSFGGGGPPILWETMTFYHNGWLPGRAGVEGYDDLYMARYRSREKAEKGHRLAIAAAERWLQEYDAAKAGESG